MSFSSTDCDASRIQRHTQPIIAPYHWHGILIQSAGRSLQISYPCVPSGKLSLLIWHRNGTNHQMTDLQLRASDLRPLYSQLVSWNIRFELHLLTFVGVCKENFKHSHFATGTSCPTAVTGDRVAASASSVTLLAQPVCPYNRSSSSNTTKSTNLTASRPWLTTGLSVRQRYLR